MSGELWGRVDEDEKLDESRDVGELAELALQRAEDIQHHSLCRLLAFVDRKVSAELAHKCRLSIEEWTMPRHED